MTSRITTYPANDPPHLHLAAIALARPVLLGNLTYSAAADGLALAAIDAGLLDRLNDAQFDTLRARLERSLVNATFRIEARAVDRIREHIAPIVARGQPLDDVVLIGWAANATISIAPGHERLLPRLPDDVVQRVCEEEMAIRPAQRAANG